MYFIRFIVRSGLFCRILSYSCSLFSDWLWSSETNETCSRKIKINERTMYKCCVCVGC